MIAAVAAVSSVFVACNKEEAESATITFVNVQNDEVTLGSGVTDYVATVRVSSNTNLESIKVHKKVGANSTQIGATITKFDEKTSHQFTIDISGITVVTEIVVTVDNGTETAKTLTINPFAQQGASISTFSNVKIYCSGADGSGLSAAASVDGSTFALANANTTNQGKCDFVYFSTSQTGAGTMYSPNNIGGADANFVPIMNTWTTKNTTTFAVLSSSTDFDGITAANIASIAGNPAAATASVNLNSVVAFKTAAGKLGVFKVSAFDAGWNPTDYCTIDIKVQQ